MCSPAVLVIRTGTAPLWRHVYRAAPPPHLYRSGFDILETVGVPDSTSARLMEGAC